MLLQHSCFDVCMIARDSVVNSRDLHAAIAQSATLRIAIDLHEGMSPAQLEQAARRSCSRPFKMPRDHQGSKPDRNPASEFRLRAIC
jgi:hypothetical protein